MARPADSYRRAFHQGLKLARGFRFEEALGCFEAAILLHDQDPRIHLQYGLALSELGRHAESVRALEKAVSLDSSSAVSSLFLGVVHLDGGQGEPARQAFERAIELEGRNILAKSYAALSRWDLGEREAAIEDLLEIDFVHTPPFEARLLARIEERFHSLKAPGGTDLDHTPFAWEYETGGLPWISTWSKRFRKARAERLVARASALDGKGRHEDALGFLELAREAAPGYGSIGEKILQARKKLFKELQKRLKREEEDGELLHRTGCLALLCGEIEVGILHLKKWIEGRKKDDLSGRDSIKMEVALRLLGQAALQRNHVQEAEHYLEDLCTMNSGEGYARYLLGKCFLRRGDRLAAVRAFIPALDWEPPFARFRLRDLVRTEDKRMSGADPSGEKENMV